MRFRRHQESARGNTLRLLTLFLILVVGVVAVIDFALTQAWISLLRGMPLPRHFHITNIGVSSLLILGGSCVEAFRLSQGGGSRVAISLGGRLLEQSGVRDPSEHRLLKVVTEMAVAARLSMPKVYVFDGQMGINAFAAGWSDKDRVIAVTEGALLHLNRAELQGVVAHEFAHIVNEDVKLNMRLIACVFGLELVHEFGSTILQWNSVASMSPMRGRSDSKPGARGLVIWAGLVLLVVGYIGLMAGKVLQAAILRQREYLADASAVQFTRNPSGIGSALRKIAHLEKARTNRFEHAHAESVSHLFIARGSPGWLNTHPPVAKRLVRIFGRAMPPLDPEIATMSEEAALEASEMESEDLARKRAARAQRIPTVRTVASDGQVLGLVGDDPADEPGH